LKASNWRLIVCSLLALSCRGGAGDDTSPKVGKEPVLVFDLSSGVSESQSGAGFFPLPFERTLLGQIKAIEAARNAASAKGYFVKLAGADLGWAATEELGRSFQELKATGKPVICHADALTNSSLWLVARGCSEVWLSPGGSVDSFGMGGQAVYFGGLLRKLRVQAEFLHMGKYKSAAEMFTDSGPSEPAKESMQSLLDSMRETWRAGIAESRPDPRAADAAENGPWLPEEARAIGLIDGVGFESEARSKLAQLTSTDLTESGPAVTPPKRDVGLVSLLFKVLSGDTKETKGPRIAVLPAIGEITYGGGGGLSSEGISVAGLTQQIRKLREDAEVTAVVLRIDSPGGSALASDLLWHELRRLAERKPVVTSVGEMAASGGYYLASATQKIVAEKTSWVGSIGVVGGKFTFGEALADLGVTAHTFTATGSDPSKTRAAYESPFTPWDDAARERVSRQMERIYRLFIERVAEGRKLPVAQVETVAEGRVWTGAQGANNGLVDELGGLTRAIEVARELAGAPPTLPVVLEGESDPFKALLGLDDDEPEQVRARARALLQQGPSWVHLLTTAERRQLGSLLPLMGNENVVVALPFVLRTDK
jgi:protease-4